MHEFAIAQDLINLIKDSLKDSKMKTVTKVTLALSDPPMLVKESLELGFGVLAKNTPCENARLIFTKGSKKGFFLIGLEGEDGD
ncbi:MAG: hydrogenase maturation nickel metallochaperone HypA [Deltaproteobacteria bacterium]|nr:hydrogenase maturation nickel metallochaperone HypA [Deltaproteobacteria bacterium]